MTYRDQVQRQVLRLLDEATRGDPDTIVDFTDLARSTGMSLNDIDDAVSALAVRGMVHVVTREYGGGSVQITAMGQDAITDLTVPDERADLRARVLRWLYERARQDRYVMSRVADIAAELQAENLPVFAAARYLEQKGYANVHRLGTTPGDPIIQITPQGQDAVDHPDQSPNTPTSTVTQHITFNAPVGQSIVGGQGHTQSAQHISLTPGTQDILQVIAAMRAIVREDVSGDRYTREDAEHAITTLEGEFSKPSEQRDDGRVAHILQKLKSYGSTIPALLSVVGQIEAVLNNRPHL